MFRAFSLQRKIIFSDNEILLLVAVGVPLGDVVGSSSLVPHAHLLQRSAGGQIVLQVGGLDLLQPEFPEAEGHGRAPGFGGVAFAPKLPPVPITHARLLAAAADAYETDERG